jgi:predicted DNA-binding transcriptional regulator AlpA
MHNFPDPAAPIAVRTDGALALTGLTRSTFYELARKGLITPVKAGRVSLWRYSDLVQLVDTLATSTAA